MRALRPIIAALLAANAQLVQAQLVQAQPAQAHVRSFRQEAAQLAFGSMTVDDARAAATAKAEWAVWEEVSGALGGLPAVSIVPPEDRLALAIGISQSAIVADTATFDAGRFGARVAVEAWVNLDALETRAAEISQDQSQWKRLTHAAEYHAALLSRLEAMERQQETEPPRTAPQWTPVIGAETRLIREINAQLWYERGLALWDARTRTFTPPRQAWEAFTRCIAFNPAHTQAYVDRARIGIGVDEEELALADEPDTGAYRALDLPQRTNLAYNAAQLAGRRRLALYARSGRGTLSWNDPLRMMPDYDEYIRVNPPSSWGYVPRAASLRGFGQGDRAIDELRRACAAGVREACEVPLASPAP